MSYLKEIAISGVSAFITIFIKNIFDRKKELQVEKKDILAKLEEERRNRPEFLITNMKDSFNRPGTCIDTHPCDLEIFVANIKKVNVVEDMVFAEYDDSILDKKSWVCREYTLKNVGKTVIYESAVISNNKRSTCIFEDKYINERVVNTGILNYYALLDRRIAPGETFTLKLCYQKKEIIGGPFCAAFEVGMRDDNGTYWVQPFFAPEDKIYESTKIPYQEYREAIMPDQAIECFKKPYLW